MAHPLSEAPAQLPLRFVPRDEASLAMYCPGPNSEALAAMQHLARGSGDTDIFLWGRPATGKSHLLQGVCREVAGASYVPLSQAYHLPPALLEGLECCPVVAVDDVQAIAGQRDWETALFHLYNRVRDSGGRCLYAATLPPAHLGLALPDLASRLAWGLVLHLAPLNDADTVTALCLRAHSRGCDLPEEVAIYLLRHYPRDLPSLFKLFDDLDQNALAAQRRLTLPFVKDFLARDPVLRRLAF